jgi:uncharacterized phage protein (TIGR02220 family)
VKRPAFQFYPADWQKDAALQSCAINARGLWIEMLCIMHQCEPYGHLAVNGRPMTTEQLARLVGEPHASVKKGLAELETAGVFSRTDDGCIYSRRMVKDERLRNVRAEAGKLGGNPNLLGGKVNQTDNHPPKQSPTPSSSSSSSSSEESKALSGKPDPHRQDAKEILSFLNEKTGKNYRPVDATLKPIIARLKDGTSVDDIRAVIAKKCREWLPDEKMAEYLRPKTLFNATNFANYEGELSA